MSAGELVPDDLILDLIRERLAEADAAEGWLLDGFPRTIPQANFLETLLEEIKQPCDFVVNLEVPDEVLIARLLSRGREDDQEDVVKNRLEVYHELTQPLIDFYRNRQKLVSVDGNQPMESVTSNLKALVQA